MKNLITYLKTLWSRVADSQSTDVSLDCRLTVGSPSGLDAKWKQNPYMRFAVVLTLIFTIGIGNAWGVIVKDTIVVEKFGGSTSTSYVTSETSGSTKKGVTAYMNNWNPANSSSKTQIRVNQGNTSSLSDANFYVYNGGAMPGNITKVELIITTGSTTENYFQIATSTSSNCNSNPSYNTSNKGTHISSTQSLQWTFSESSGIRYFRISCAKNGGTVKASYVVITYVYHTVTYNGNGNTGGTVPTDATKYIYNEDVDTKANSGSLAKTGFTFSGWNTKTDGTGTTFAASTSKAFKITKDTTLYAKWVSAGPACADPAAPSNGLVSSTGATITFAESGNYDIYYSTSSTAPTGSTAATTTVSSASSKALTGLAVGTTYYYWARKDCGGGSKSDYVAGSPTNFTTTVPAPTGVSAGSLTMDGATFTITDANNVNSYDVYCSESSTTPEAGTTPSASGTSKSIAVTGLTAGRTYYYWARAKGPNAKSTWYGGSTFTTLTLSSISVSTAPTKTKYLVGDNFDPTALVITRTFSDKSSDTYTYAGHTAEFSFSPATNAALTALNTSVTITYGGQTASQAINVYSVAVNKVNMSSVAIADAGVSASCSGRTLSQSVGSTNYKFNTYAVTAGGVGISGSTITGTPTGNVTINAKFHDPITVTKGTGTGTSTFTISASEIKYNTSVTVTCAAAAGYKNQWTLTVTPSDGATYSSSGSTTSITISNITKDITVDLAYTECTDHGASSITGGASDGDDYGPIHAYFKYSTSQILYTKSDLDLARGKKGSIKSIYFQYSGAAAMAARTIKIYMANTTLSSLTTSKYVPYASFSKVYDGSFSCSSAGWYEIILDTPFEYDGVANLAVMVDDNSNSYEDNKNFKYHSATGAQIYKRQDSGDIDPSSWTPTNAIDSRPNTKFCIEEDNMDEYTVNWYVNGSIERTQTGYEGETLTSIPTPVSGDCDGTKAFVGWYDDTYTHATDAPDFVEPEVIPGGDANYYAVFANVSGSDVYTEQTSDITSEGVYVLVSEYSSSYSYMPNTESSTNPTLGTGITMTTSAGVTTLTNKVTRAMLWDFTEDDNYTNYFHVRPHGDATIGLGTTSSTGTNIRITADYKDDSFKFTTTDADQKWDIYNGHYLAVYSGSEWRNYSNTTTNQNGVFHIFKQTSSATYSNFATSCCTQHTITLASSGSVTGGTFNSGGVAKACATREITLTATPSNSGYVFNGWTVTNSSTSANVTTTVLGAGHANDNPATMTMPDYNVTVTAAFSAISSISVKTAPTKTVYLEGETFDPTGLVITATYANSATVDVPYSGNEAAFTFSPTTATSLTTSNMAVTITYSGQTVNQSITVYSVTLQALDENGGAIRVGGPAAPTRDGATVTKAANVDNYVYKEWVVSGATLADGANANQKIITDPTGAVTVTVKYYLPRVVKWIVNGEEWKPYTDTGSGTDGTAEVARGAQWKTLTLPTDPNPLNDEGCGDKFIGWTNAEISGQLDKDDDAAAISTLVDSNLLNSANKSGKTKTINANPYIFYAVFADYVE